MSTAGTTSQPQASNLVSGAAVDDKNASTQNATTDIFSSVSGALGRSLTRAAALYFARPVRLFRPSKVTGWMTLQSAAKMQNESLSPQYLSLLIRTEGWKIIPRHFLPPLIVNSALGAILFETFTVSNRRLRRRFPDTPTVVIASVSGAVAGAAHAFAGAPADNVRLVLERGLTPNSVHGIHSGWRQAWMEVFRQVDHVDKPHLEGNKVVTGTLNPVKSRKEARELRAWIKDVKGMSRGWEGVWWGVGKDATGFAVFFAVFDVSRHLANEMAAYLDPSITLRRVAQVTSSEGEEEEEDRFKPSSLSKESHARIGHGIVLASGGIAAGLGYEYVSRPFDNARRIVSHTTHTAPDARHSFWTIMSIMTRHVHENGVISLLASHQPSASSTAAETGSSVLRARALILLRALGRLGPWGIGFLMWEGFAPDS